MERRGVWPGEESADTHTVNYKTFTGFEASRLICSFVSRWGCFQPTMWRRTTLTTADVAPDVDPVCLNTTYYAVCGGVCVIPTIALTHVHECGCVREVLLPVI